MLTDASLTDTQAVLTPHLQQQWARLLPSEDLRALTRHPLLVALAGGKVDMATLRLLLEQHHLYSRNFTRFLCILIARMPEMNDARLLLQNLAEELGADQSDGTSHAELFLLSMRIAGCALRDLLPLQGTRELTASMYEYCRHPDPLEGLAAMCLGAEAIVPIIYTPVIAAMQHLRLPAEGRLFFEVHVADDEEHAIAMLDIMIRLIANDRAKAARVRDVASAMIGRRLRFLDDIWAQSRHATAPRC